MQNYCLETSHKTQLKRYLTLSKQNSQPSLSRLVSSFWVSAGLHASSETSSGEKVSQVSCIFALREGYTDWETTQKMLYAKVFHVEYYKGDKSVRVSAGVKMEAA